VLAKIAAPQHGVVTRAQLLALGLDRDAIRYMLWRVQRVIVELDSREFHDADQPFEEDRERDAELVAAGWRVVRVTWRRLTGDPAREAERLANMLR
jgi:very-short-patch-repair endonuclease